MPYEGRAADLLSKLEKLSATSTRDEVAKIYVSKVLADEGVDIHELDQIRLAIHEAFIFDYLSIPVFENTITRIDERITAIKVTRDDSRPVSPPVQGEEDGEGESDQQ